jgi:hypothetical protein
VHRSAGLIQKLGEVRKYLVEQLIGCQLSQSLAEQRFLDTAYRSLPLALQTLGAEQVFAIFGRLMQCLGTWQVVHSFVFLTSGDLSVSLVMLHLPFVCVCVCVCVCLCVYADLGH